MHIPGKPEYAKRPKNSMFRNTASRRLAYANHLRSSVINSVDPVQRFAIQMMAQRLEDGVGRTTTRNTNNQRKQRRARRQWWAAGDRFAFSRN